MKAEEWKPIEETKNNYSVSNLGRVKNNRTGLILKPIRVAKGYERVNLKVDGRCQAELIHRLVAKAFIENPEEKPEVNHKNGIHDDNRLCNLEWVTGEENRKHAYETGLRRHKDMRKTGYLYNVWHTRCKKIMCLEWQDYKAFYEWCYEHGYENGKFVARRNAEELYSPSNCYITSSKKHPSKLYICFGEKMSLNEISQKYNILRATLDYRLKNGMDIEAAVLRG